VVNLEESLALTHNYVSTSNLGDVLHFLRDKTDQISGVRDRCATTAVDGEEAVGAGAGAVLPAEMYTLFVERLRSVLTSACLEACISQSNRSSPNIIQHQRGGVVASLRSRRRCMKAKRRHVMSRGGRDGNGGDDDDGGDDEHAGRIVKRAIGRHPTTTTTTHSSGGLFLFDFKLE
jgi:hypothetical protein